MSLTKLSIEAAVSWTLEATFGNRPVASKQQDSVSFGSQPDVTVQNKLYAATLPIPATTTTTLDLTNLIAPNGEAIAFSAVYGICLEPTGDTVAIDAGVSNGLVWRTETVDDGGCSLFVKTAAKTVDSTHKTIKLTAGATDVVLQISIWGVG